MVPIFPRNTLQFLLKILLFSVLLGWCAPQQEIHAQRLATEFREIQLLPNLDTLIRYRRGGDWWFGGMVGGIGGYYFGTINVNRIAPDDQRGTISLASGDGNGYYSGLLAEYIPVGEKLGAALKVSLFDKRIGTASSDVISGVSVNGREVDSLHRYTTIATNYYIAFSPEMRYNLNSKGLHLMGGLDAEILVKARASTVREFDNIGHITEQRVDPTYSASPFRFGAHVGVGLDIVSATISSGVRFRLCPYITLNSGTVTTTNLGSSWNTIFARFGIAVKFGFDNISDTIRHYDSSFVEPPHYLATIQWNKGISVPSYTTSERLAVADIALNAIEAPPVDVTKETIVIADEIKPPTQDSKTANTEVKPPNQGTTSQPDIKTTGTNTTISQQDSSTSSPNIAAVISDEVRPNTPVISSNEGVKPITNEKKVPKVNIGDKKTFYFSTSKSINLTPESKEYYDGVVEYLKKNPRAIVYIVGHTDNQGTDEELQKISDDRALQVRGYFERKGIQRRRLFPSGKSSQEPIRTNTTEAGRRENRRVEVTIGNGK